MRWRTTLLIGQEALHPSFSNTYHTVLWLRYAYNVFLPYTDDSWHRYFCRSCLTSVDGLSRTSLFLEKELPRKKGNWLLRKLRNGFSDEVTNFFLGLWIGHTCKHSTVFKPLTFVYPIHASIDISCCIDKLLGRYIILYHLQNEFHTPTPDPLNMAKKHTKHIQIHIYRKHTWRSPSVSASN